MSPVVPTTLMVYIEDEAGDLKRLYFVEPVEDPALAAAIRDVATRCGELLIARIFFWNELPKCVELWRDAQRNLQRLMKDDAHGFSVHDGPVELEGDDVHAGDAEPARNPADATQRTTLGVPPVSRWPSTPRVEASREDEALIAEYQAATARLRKHRLSREQYRCLRQIVGWVDRGASADTYHDEVRRHYGRTTICALYRRGLVTYGPLRPTESGRAAALDASRLDQIEVVIGPQEGTPWVS